MADEMCVDLMELGLGFGVVEVAEDPALDVERHFDMEFSCVR